MIGPSLERGRTIWRWYSALLIANTLDLLFTYTAVERGFQEWNPVLRPMLLTPWPAALKLTVLGLLGCALWQTVRRTQSSRSVSSLLLQSVTVVYLIVIAFHIVGLSVADASGK